MDLLITFIPLIFFMVLLYFVTIKPQKKRQQEHRNMLENLKRGDLVVTIGGLHGLVEEQDDVAQTIVIDCEGVYLTFEKRAIARVVTQNAQNQVANDSVEHVADNNTTVEDLGSNQPPHTDEEA